MSVSRKPLLPVPVVITLTRLRRRLGPPPAPLTLAAVCSVPLLVHRGLPRGRPRVCLVWLAHMWAYKVAFEVPYDHPEQLRRRLRIDQPLVIDRKIGLGVPPSQRLQRRLRRPPGLTALDKLLTGVYVLWEVEPHLALAWLMARHPDRLPAAAVRLGLTFDATLLGYFSTPTAPPWWASEFEGRMDGQVRRVVAEVMRSVQRKPRPGTPEDHKSGSNPWAAWPSDHFATALSTAIALGRASHRAGALGFLYTGLLGFTLVYSGEHYVIDLILGTLVALAIDRTGALASDRWPRLLEPELKASSRWKRLIQIALF